MALKLQIILPPTRSGRTFFVASSLLGLGALAQLILMGVFLLRGGVSRHPVAAPAIHFAESFPNVMRPDSSAPLPSFGAPTPVPSGVSSSDVQASTLTGGSLASPTPAPELAGPGGGVMGLVEQARELRQRGDMPSALARLREAQNAAPDNPQIIAEMAITYERMKLDDRAFEQWQRLYNMGDATGALYYLAESRLNAAPAAPAANSANAPSTAAGPIAGFANNGQPNDQEPTVLKITDIHLEQVEDPSVEEKRILRIVVKDRPGSAIDPTRVRILTYFYDQTDDRAIVLTNAQTAYAWVTPEPINWAGDKSEVLETTYLRPKAGPPAPAPTPADTAPPPGRRGAKGKKSEVAAAPPPAPSATPYQHRTYYGYVVRLYYDRQLQDVHADPVRLLQQYPPQLTLSAE